MSDNTCGTCRWWEALNNHAPPINGRCGFRECDWVWCMKSKDDTCHHHEPRTTKGGEDE